MTSQVLSECINVRSWPPLTTTIAIMFGLQDTVTHTTEPLTCHTVVGTLCDLIIIYVNLVALNNLLCA